MNDVQRPSPGQQAVGQLTAFVESQRQAGADRETARARLMAAGIEEPIANQLVEQVYAASPSAQGTQIVTASSLLPAVLGGVAGAAVGGFIWGLIAVGTGYEIGWIAWGVGLLAGFGVLLFAGGRRGTPLQLVAVAAAVLGILIGKYFTFYYAFREYVSEEMGAEAVAELSMFSAGVVQLFGTSLTMMVSGFDALWVFLAVATAWGIPKVREAELTPAA